MYKITITNHDKTKEVVTYRDKKNADAYVEYLKNSGHKNMSFSTNF